MSNDCNIFRLYFRIFDIVSNLDIRIWRNICEGAKRCPSLLWGGRIKGGAWGSLSHGSRGSNKCATRTKQVTILL
jgi:hypothetical protein